jgi:hypothetical protein
MGFWAIDRQQERSKNQSGHDSGFGCHCNRTNVIFFAFHLHQAIVGHRAMALARARMPSCGRMPITIAFMVV